MAESVTISSRTVVLRHMFLVRALTATETLFGRGVSNLVQPNRTADMYALRSSLPDLSAFDSAFPALFFVPGLTFGNAPRMMR